MEENNNTKVRKLASDKHVAALRFELHEIKELCQRRANQISGKFVAKTDPDNVEWEVEFKFGTVEGSENFLSVFIWKKNVELNVFIEAFEIHARNSAGHTMRKGHGENTIFKKLMGWQNFISFESLNALSDGHLSFDVWIKYSGKLQVKDLPEPAAFDSFDGTLQSDYLTLFHSENGADVTFSLIGGRTIKAHSHILMARSSYFDALFRSGMKEVQTKTIEVKDVDAEAFVDLMKYIYSEMIPDNLAETAIVLLPMADRYCIASLKSKCCR